MVFVDNEQTPVPSEPVLADVVNDSTQQENVKLAVEAEGVPSPVVMNERYPAGTSFNITRDATPFTIETLPKPGKEQDDESTESRGTTVELPGDIFQVRKGPNYASTKAKEASGTCIYELLTFDVWHAKEKYFHVAERLDLDALIGDRPRDVNGVPMLFLFVTMLPDWTIEDQSGFLLVQVFRLSDWAIDALGSAKDETIAETAAIASETSGATDENDNNSSETSDATNKEDDEAATLLPPCLSLLRRYVQASTDDALDLRFKVIPRVLNLNDGGLPWALQMAMTTQYNGKPFLSRPQHVKYTGDGYCELDMDVYEFNWLSKWALKTMLDGWKKDTDIIRRLVADFAIVIEGHDDGELPEQLIGAFQLQNLKLSAVERAPWEKSTTADDE